MTSPLAWILARPLITHTLLAALYTALLGLGLKLLWPLPLWAVAAIVCSAFWFGREAGQREHDLKNLGVHPVIAWLGAEFAFRWSLDNLLQWLVAAGSSAAVAAALTAAGL